MAEAGWYLFIVASAGLSKTGARVNPVIAEMSSAGEEEAGGTADGIVCAWKLAALAAWCWMI
jgi:hypothetical protein